MSETQTFAPVAGGICAPQGFAAAGVHCGIRHNHEKPDLALIKADVRCAGAACYTTNKVYGAPITVDREHLADGYAQAILVNSGNANTCAPGGLELARATCELAAQALGIPAADVLPSSTGVIGQRLPVECIEQHLPEIQLTDNGSEKANLAIMTTDTRPKEAAVTFEIGGKTVTIGGMAKGSGMIHPNMCTMLSFITTDAKISGKALRKALRADVEDTYNMISVDGDTSTNDTVLLLANGMAGNDKIRYGTPEYKRFCEALHYVNETLAKKMAGDGEGATALFEAKITGAQTKEQAKVLAKSIVCSNLTKTAIAGHDANWGRILCAMGYSGAQFDPEKVDLYFESAAGKLKIIENGTAADYSEEKATEILSQPEVTAIADIKEGNEEAAAWGCDLTHGYIEINADYRS